MVIAAHSARAQDTDGDADAPRGRANYPPGAVVQSLAPDAGADLRRYMTEIAHDPRDLDALIGAGREAVRMGDADAALGFFTRADGVAPRDARVKAGMASAMVIAEQPRQALDLFGEAVSLGADEGEIAADRGLAYDMVGDPARAQQDYRLALRAHDTPELRRRLALSLAITGQRDAAAQTLDAQLRQNDRAGWRTQAFVLALTGDAAGAQDIARRVMPPGTATGMAPFLARLAALSPAQKAMAVHFGEFPAAPGTQLASAAPPPPPPIVQVAPPNPATTTLSIAGPASTGPRRRPGAPLPGEIGLRPTQLPPRPVQVARAEPAATPAPATVQDNAEGGPPAPPRPLRRFEPADEGDTGAAAPAERAEAGAPAADAQPGFALVPHGVQPVVPTAEPPAPPRPVERPARTDFAEVAAAVDALPPEVQLSPPSPARAVPARPAPDHAPARRPTPPANASRHWVQIATADRAGLAREFARLRTRASQLGDRDAYTAPMRSSSRLLVGPFDSAADAQAFVRQLGGRVPAFAWTSPEGQAVDRVSGASGGRAIRRAASADADTGTRLSRSGGGRTATSRNSRASRTDDDDDTRTTRSSRGRAAATSRTTTRSGRNRADAEDDDRPAARSRRGAAAASSRSGTRSSRSRSVEDDQPATRSSRSGRATTADRGSTARSRRSTRANDDDAPASRSSRSRSRPDARTPPSRGRTRH